MVFKINGIDMLPYIAKKGLVITRKDTDKGITTMNGDIYRGRVTSKKNCKVTCISLTTEQAGIVLGAILPEYVTVEYTDPQEGHVTKEMYSNNAPATVAIVDDDGNELWSGISFTVQER